MAAAIERLILDFRMADIGGGVGAGTVYPLDGKSGPSRSDTTGRRVVFLLHGFNVDRQAGRISLVKFMELLRPQLDNALLIGVLWPGDSIFNALSYAFEGKAADDTARKLAAWIDDTINTTAKLALVGHSKGCRVAMRTVEELAKLEASHEIEAVCLMAAAIDRTALTDVRARAFAAATRRTRGISVLSSTNDKVLRLAYPAGDLLQGWFYAKSDEPGFALGLTGPRHRSNADAVAKALVHHTPIAKEKNVDHGDYLPGKGAIWPAHENAAAWVAGVLAGTWDQPYATP